MSASLSCLLYCCPAAPAAGSPVRDGVVEQRGALSLVRADWLQARLGQFPIIEVGWNAEPEFQTLHIAGATYLDSNQLEADERTDKPRQWWETFLPESELLEGTGKSRHL